MKEELTLPKEIIEAYKKLDVPSISDAMDKLKLYGGLLNIKAVVPDTYVCGQAFTVHYVPCGQIRGTVGDFIDDILPGEVAVIDNNGRQDCTVWGDIMSIYAAQRGIAGTVIDGVCRDINVIRELRYPIYTKGTYMVTGKDRVYVDRVNDTVSIAGVQVNPGDLIVGDNTGVVAVPFSKAEEVLKVAQGIEQVEQMIVSKVKSGMKLKDARKETGYHTLQTPVEEK
ncbi:MULTISPECIES: RraA family protein [unclassified Clostridium]|jgi:4-hydroxy-4-methyl-2-oxoglutarate aldolase|uniref:RraA family protein n=1 Tax=unclassified Clostridium TaxID=2614128 RepID=UPI001106B095|nr:MULTISPECIES: RraA family protein [unclassified Clostridium]